MTYFEDILYCSGANPINFASRTCEIPISVLRMSPYNLDYPNIVVAKVRSRNINGWSDYSEPNTQGAIIFTEPGQMNAPTRGPLTNQYQIDVQWD